VLGRDAPGRSNSPALGGDQRLARFLNLSAVETQGQTQETFHPNAYAQQALGNCLALAYAEAADAACNSTPGDGTGAVSLRPPG